MSRSRNGFVRFLWPFLNAVLKRSARHPSAHTAVRSDGAAGSSPGRHGFNATRDLTRHEIQQLRPSYHPVLDGDPDPGEVVWTWVPYADNDGRGKDRPVVIIARIDAHTTAGCYLSTKQHQDFVSVGPGGWDRQGRESFVAPDRVLRVTDTGVRREGNVLSRESFERAMNAIARKHGLRRETSGQG